MKFHEAKKTSLSIALFHAGNPKQAGIVENITADGLIKVFTEKPEHPKTNLASAAMFLASPSVIKGIPALKDGQIIDFSKEILPDYAGKMFGYEIKGFNIDIGTLETLREAEEYAKKQ
jgi:NDP-sugar pyrophosphorylase family protein